MTKLETEKKFNLTNLENRELKVYLFLSRPTEVKIPVEAVHLIFSYDLDKAEERVVKDVPMGFYIKKVGSIPVRELFKKVETEGFFIKTAEKETETKKPMTKEQFINNLMLASDEFVKKEDREQFKKILENAKKN